MIVAWICAFVAVAGLAMVCANLALFPTLVPAASSARNVVACVPMRNEERCVARCIASLLDQPEVAAVVVCDDDSSDATALIAEEFARLDRRVIVMHARGSKRIALIAAAARARSLDRQYLFFTDADVELKPGAIGALVSYARRTNAAAVTAWPSLTRAGWADRLLMPAIVMLLLHALPMRLSRTGDPRIAAGNGQLFLVESEAYFSCGGHAASDSLVEDVALARQLASAGYAPVYASAARIASTDGYGSLDAAVRGLGRSLYHGGGAAACVAFGLWQLLGFVLPFLLLAFAPVPSALAIAAAILSRAIVAARMREPVFPAMLVPFGAAAAASAAFASALLGLRGSLSWRERPLGA